MIYDELIELFFDMYQYINNTDGSLGVNTPEDLDLRMDDMSRRLKAGEQYALGETKDEFTTSIAADRLGVSRPTLMKYIQEGKIEAHLVGRHHRIKKTEVERFAKQRREEQYKALQELWKLDY